MKKQISFYALSILTILCFGLVSCGDSESEYIVSINNNTSYNIVVSFHDSTLVHLSSKKDILIIYPQDSTIVCLPNKETIIEQFLAGSVKNMSCASPYIFKYNIAEIIIDGGNKILTKDVSNDDNWHCYGEENWSLIMVGNYYSKITTTFVINDEDIKDLE